MLRSTRSLGDYRIQATDGEVGFLDQFYFDDRNWNISYAVVEIGTWLHNKRILLSPTSITSVDEVSKTIQTELTVEQIKRSSDVHSHTPLALREPHDYYLYFGWPNYLGMGQKGTTAQRPDPDAHLRSANVVGRYRIIALDGEIGHIDDFLVDDSTWTIRYVVADTRNWWPGKKVLLATDWILWMSWAESNAYVNLTRHRIATAPEYDPRRPLTRDYEIELYAYHHRLPYWEHRAEAG